MNKPSPGTSEHAPLGSLSEWEADVIRRYPESGTNHKAKDEFRNYAEPARPTVREFYRINHTNQTYEFVLRKKKEFLPLNRKKMSTWDAMEFLNTLVDDSDPDTDLSQLQHLLQTSEAIRADGHPDWFVLTGLLHDLGKVLCLFGEAQWAVVGTHSPWDARTRTRSSILSTSCTTRISAILRFKPGAASTTKDAGWRTSTCPGARRVYLWRCKGLLAGRGVVHAPVSFFYAAHREGAYEYLMNDHDKKMFEWVKKFNPTISIPRARLHPIPSRFVPTTIS